MRIIRHKTKWPPATSSIKFDLSEAQLKNYISVAYRDHHAWLKYVPMYHDLFTSIDEARVKAKTHSVMVTCNYLLLNRGCPHHTLYENFVAEVNQKKIKLSPDLLCFQTQLAFFISLCEIR
jgi:hypothetical protein